MTGTAPANPPAPGAPAPPPPIPAPVSLTNVNTLDFSSVVLWHAWQEFHWKAATTVYKGKTDDDKKVAEFFDKDNVRLEKSDINMGFCEWAMATFEALVPDGQELYLYWRIEDINDKVLIEHADFSKANFDSKNAKAKLATAKYSWRWDGRVKNADGRMNFLPADETVWSTLTVKNKNGVTLEQTASVAVINVRGEPYRIFTVSTPKNDADMEWEKDNRCDGRWLSSAGARMATDCLVKIYRGAAAAGDDGHVVFMGHGAIEATKFEFSSGSTKHGAVATPHDRDFRAYIRKGKHGGIEFNLCELADDNPTPDTYWKITLPQLPGYPEPVNPFSGPPTGAFKDGVHCHQSFTSGGTNFVVDDASVGCSTFKDLSTRTADNPAVVKGDLINIKASVGHWNGEAPAATNNTPWGPPLDGGRPGTFYNKQNKREHVSDAGLEDSDDKPLIKAPVPGSTANPPETTEPLHMQPTVQHAVLGGFLQCEIPWWSKEGEPDQQANRQARLRVRLEEAPVDSRYWQYHRFVAFGHSVEVSNKKGTFALWIPKLVKRLWNGYSRNVGITGNTQFRWYFERRNTDGTVVNLGKIGSEANSDKEWTALAAGNVGKFSRADVEFPKFYNTEEDQGARLFSVFRYRVEIKPKPLAGTHVWDPLTGGEDLFTKVTARARMLDETIEVDGTKHYFQGQTELELPISFSPLPNLPPNAPNPGGGGNAPGRQVPA
jgi:hypothetical protein